jgi:hypothetical protein
LLDSKIEIDRFVNGAKWNDPSQSDADRWVDLPGERPERTKIMGNKMLGRYAVSAFLTLAIGVLAVLLTKCFDSFIVAGTESHQPEVPPFPTMAHKPVPKQIADFHGCPPEGKQLDPERPLDPDLNRLKNRIDEPEKPFMVTMDQILAIPSVKAAEGIGRLRKDWSKRHPRRIRAFRRDTSYRGGVSSGSARREGRILQLRSHRA